MASKKTLYAHKELNLVSDQVSVNSTPLTPHQFASVSYSLSADQVITTSAPAFVNWETLGGIGQPAVAIPQVTLVLGTNSAIINTAGQYTFQFQNVWESAGAPVGYRSHWLQLNGGPVLGYTSQPANLTNPDAEYSTVVLDCVPGDLIQCKVTHAQGADLDILGSTGFPTTFTYLLINARF